MAAHWLLSSKSVAEQDVATDIIAFTKPKSKQSISETEYKERLATQLQKMRIKDATSPLLSKQVSSSSFLDASIKV